jgi:hypothetical protein
MQSATDRDTPMKDSYSGQDNAKNYDKIGGWLILFAFGLVLYPVQTLYSLATNLFPAILSDNWAALTTPTNSGFHTLWAPLVIFELVGSSTFFIYSGVHGQPILAFVIGAAAGAVPDRIDCFRH